MTLEQANVLVIMFYGAAALMLIVCFFALMALDPKPIGPQTDMQTVVGSWNLVVAMAAMTQLVEHFMSGSSYAWLWLLIAIVSAFAGIGKLVGKRPTT